MEQRAPDMPKGSPGGQWGSRAPTEVLLICEQPGTERARREGTALTDPWAGDLVLCGLGQLSLTPAAQFYKPSG